MPNGFRYVFWNIRPIGNVEQPGYIALAVGIGQKSLQKICTEGRVDGFVYIDHYHRHSQSPMQSSYVPCLRLRI